MILPLVVGIMVFSEGPGRASRARASRSPFPVTASAFAPLPWAGLPVLDYRDGVDHQGEYRDQERPSGFCHFLLSACGSVPLTHITLP